MKKIKCSFCDNEISPSTGKIVVLKDATILYFCKSKCERNFQIRNPRKVKWTNIFHKDHKEQVQKENKTELKKEKKEQSNKNKKEETQKEKKEETS